MWRNRKTPGALPKIQPSPAADKNGTSKCTSRVRPTNVRAVSLPDASRPSDASKNLSRVLMGIGRQGGSQPGANWASGYRSMMRDQIDYQQFSAAESCGRAGGSPCRNG